ncbi:MAG: hypothetical protein ISR91_04780 [Candidatus Delongbacteria bacterium]|nr:hypothetical protein [Candidatus Delongbacteria bacterium]
MISQRISLSGMPGCRKEEIGISLAQRLGYIFINLDEMLDGLRGGILQVNESDFDDSAVGVMESWLLDRCLSLNRVILGSGGGAFINERLQERLLRETFSIYLLAAPAQLLKRLRRTSANALPGYQGELRWEQIQSILLSRQSVFEQALLTLPVDNGDVPALTDKILVQMLRHQTPGGLSEVIS